MKHVDIKGIIVPICTPFNADETVNHEVLKQEGERMIANGIHGIFCFGTNGEGYILNGKEKREILETMVKAVNHRVPVYAGTGCVSTAETIEQSLMAKEVGADVLSIITPSFAKASQDELYEHYAAVARAVDMPIILYNIPARTGNALAPETVERLLAFDNIIGIKDSSGVWENILAYLEVAKKRDDFTVLSGNDSLILPCLKNGGTGAIAGCANVYPRTLSSIYDYFKAGDLENAQKAQDSIVTLRGVFKYGNPNTVVKKAVNLLGYPVGDCRRPFNGLCEEGVEALKKVLEDNKALGMH